MVNILELGRILGEEITFDPGVCLYPGRFKPPHKRHFNVVKELRSRSYIKKIIIIISPKTVDGITAQQSKAIWDMYFQDERIQNVEVIIDATGSPIKTIMSYIGNSQSVEPVYVVGGIDEVDDQNYLQSLQNTFGSRVKPLNMAEKDGEATAPNIRAILTSNSPDAVKEEEFKKTLPAATAQRENGTIIYNMLEKTVIKPEKEAITENFEPGVEQIKIALPDTYSSLEALKSVLNMQGYDLVKLENNSIDSAIIQFAEWCCMMLDIQNIPPVNIIPDLEFSKRECSFGGYDPASNIIHLAVHGRHIVDTLRTLAHELVHCKQNESSGINLEDGKTGSYVENEANAMAGVIMREYGKRNPELFRGTLEEGIDDPVQPGILKKRLGKLSCSRVRAEKAKLKNKGTHYAKALQRYLNYHCQ